jgi:hypothetical protein
VNEGSVLTQALSGALGAVLMYAFAPRRLTAHYLHTRRLARILLDVAVVALMGAALSAFLIQPTTAGGAFLGGASVYGLLGTLVNRESLLREWEKSELTEKKAK